MTQMARGVIQRTNYRYRLAIVPKLKNVDLVWKGNVGFLELMLEPRYIEMGHSLLAEMIQPIEFYVEKKTPFF